MNNWKTTVVGVLTGGGISINAILVQGLTVGWKQALLGVGIALLGALAHDSNNPTAIK